MTNCTCGTNPQIGHPSFVMCHLSFVICHLSFVICHLSFVICHLSFVICHLSFVICHLSFVICAIRNPQSSIRNLHRGMLPCLRAGFESRLLSSMRSSAISFLRVMRGSITSSIYPRCDAM